MTTAEAAAGTHRSAAPIDYDDIRLRYQLVRLGIAVLVAALGLLALALESSGWLYLVAPGSAVAAHAAWRLARPAAGPMDSLLGDVTLFGMLLTGVGGLHGAQIAAFAYLAAAALLMLPPRRAAGVLAYAALWAVASATLAPLTELRQVAGAGTGSLDRIAGLPFLALLGGLLLTASHSLRRLRRRQEEALHAERAANRLKDEFVSMVSHEFRTPLTSIAGFVEALRDNWPQLSPAEVDEFLAIAHTQTMHLSHLVEDVLVIPRLEAGRLPFDLRTFELRPVVHQVVSVLLPAEGREVEVAIPGGVLIHADPQRVSQVLRNLLENAIKYGGDQILVEGEPDGARYCIVVADNGPGVPRESRHRIFDVFEQATKGDARTDRGMGLGLPIARRLTEAMGGELWHESRFPTGARFCLTLPLPGTEAAAAGVQPLASSAGTSRPQPSAAVTGAV